MVDKRVIVLGAGGFIGSNFSRFLKQRGMEVLGIDIKDSPFTNFETVNIDLEIYDIRGLLREYQPEFLVNLVGNGSVGVSMEKPLYDFRSGPLIFQKIVESVRLSDPGIRILNISSAAVYGQPEKLPIDELAPVKPVSPYGYNKYIGELIGNNYSDNYSLRLATARIFSAYGRGLKKQILWDLCCKCTNSIDVFLNGKGTETRDFIHIGDICEALYKIMENSLFNKDVYNVASGSSTSIRTIGALVLGGFERGIENLKFNQVSRSGDPLNWRADTKLINSLGFRPRIDIEEGVREYVQWFRFDRK